MCGLNGVMGDLVADDVKVYADLLWTSALRGVDSTGVAVVSDQSRDEAHIMKQMGGPELWLDRKSFIGQLASSNLLMMGHNRSKTVGEVNTRNAHPFRHGHIVGMHNGSLEWSSKNRIEGTKSFDTDSEAIVWSIAEKGIDDTVKNMKGAWALVWYDTKEHTLSMYRNAERFIYYVYTEDMKRMFWASESAMLYLCLSRRGIKMNKVKIVSENQLITWKFPEEWTKEAVIAAPTRRAIVPPKDLPFQGVAVMGPTSSVTDRALVRRFPSTTLSYFNRADKLLERMSYLVVRKIGHSFYRDFIGKQLFQQDFELLMANGCAICTMSPGWGQSVRFLRTNEFLCNSCCTSKNTEIMSSVDIALSTMG